MIALFLLVLWPAAAQEVRLLVEVDAEGIEVLAFGRGAPARRPLRPPVQPGELALQVRSESDELLFRVPVPDPRHRSFVGPEGLGVSRMRPRGRILVDIPWPDDAAYVTDGEGRRWRPPGPAPSSTGGGKVVAQQIFGSGPSDRRVDLVIVGDGYTSKELGDFATDAQAVVDHLRTTEPWTHYEAALNVWRIDVASVESGAAKDEKQKLDTAFSCFYDCQNTARLVCCDDAAVLSLVQSVVPDHEGILVLSNSEDYGGSGSASYAVSYVGSELGEVTAHELGHSLFGLADEYPYTNEAAPDDWYPNCTDDKTGDWDEWLGYDDVDVYQGCRDDWYRPRDVRCMMHVMDEPLCPVCLEWAVLNIHVMLGGLVAAVDPPAGSTLTVGSPATTTNKSAVVSVETPLPPELLEFRWELDGTELDEDGPTIELICGEGSGELMVYVSDPTPWVRRRQPGVVDWIDGPWEIVNGPCDTGEPIVDTGEGKGSTTCGGCSSGSGLPSALVVGLWLLGLGRRTRRT